MGGWNEVVVNGGEDKKNSGLWINMCGLWKGKSFPGQLLGEILLVVGC